MYDANQDYCIDLDEFAAIYNEVVINGDTDTNNLNNCPQEAKDKFEQLDYDKDGKFDEIEFSIIYFHYLQDNELTKEELLTQYDADHDGKLSLEEFCELYLNEIVEGGDDGESTVLDDWLAGKNIVQHEGECVSTFRIEWVEGAYRLWSAHDCDEYELTVCVTLQEGQYDAYVESMSTGADFQGCENLNNGWEQCSFRLTPDNDKFGLQFNIEFDGNVSYTNKWVLVGHEYHTD
jgi:Ca2+-binding EF-hand superfamily protein